MSVKTMKKGAAANTTKPLVGLKTTGEDEADLVFSRPVSELYGFDTDDKYAVSFDTEGTTDYCLVSFFVNGVLPSTGGYAAMLSDDGYTIRWSRPIDAFLFSMEHLRSIMGRAYSDSHVRVRSYDDVTQAISRDKIEQDVNGLFWGETPGDPPQEAVHRHHRDDRDAVPGTASPRAHHRQEWAPPLPVPHDRAGEGPARGSEEDGDEEGRQDPTARDLRDREQPGDYSQPWRVSRQEA